MRCRAGRLVDQASDRRNLDDNVLEDPFLRKPWLETPSGMSHRTLTLRGQRRLSLPLFQFFHRKRLCKRRHGEPLRLVATRTNRNPFFARGSGCANRNVGFAGSVEFVVCAWKWLRYAGARGSRRGLTAWQCDPFGDACALQGESVEAKEGKESWTYRWQVLRQVHDQQPQMSDALRIQDLFPTDRLASDGKVNLEYKLVF